MDQASHETFKRFPDDVNIKFRRLEFSESQRELRFLKNSILKTTGTELMRIFILSDQLFPVGTIVETVFYFQAQDREVKALSSVVWNSKEKDDHGMGLQVFKMAEDIYSGIVLRAKRGPWIQQLESA